MITIDSRFRGPLGMTNGGMAAGILAEGLPGPTQVRLEQPVPYSTALFAHARGPERQLLHNDVPVALAGPALEPIPAPLFIDAESVLGQPRWPITEDFYADCFVCGRAAPDGLGIELRRVGERRFAAVWRPSACDAIPAGPVASMFLWAALDCPGGYSALVPTQTMGLLGSLAVDVRSQPDSDADLVVIGEGTYVEGRKLGASTAIYTTNGENVAVGSAIWISLGVAA